MGTIHGMAAACLAFGAAFAAPATLAQQSGITRDDLQRMTFPFQVARPCKYWSASRQVSWRQTITIRARRSST